MSATTALRQSRYQTVAQTETKPNTSIIPPSALLPEKESWTCSERGTRIGSKHPSSVVHTEGVFIPVTNYTSVPLSLRRLLLNLFRHVDQTKAVEHPINIRHTYNIQMTDMEHIIYASCVSSQSHRAPRNHYVKVFLMSVRCNQT